MNKKAIESELLVKLIIFVVVIAIAFIIYINIDNLLKEQSNKEAVATWVKIRTVTKGGIVIKTATGGGIGSDQPPVTHLEEPLEIKDEADLVPKKDKPPKIFKEMADSMVDCWTAFDKGGSDFINGWHKTSFCFPCRAIVFSDEIKKKKIEIVGFNKYLNETHTRGEESPTYLQILANDKNYVLEAEDLKEDKISTDANIHIFFFAASGRGLLNIISNILIGDDVNLEETKKGFNPQEVAKLRPQTEETVSAGVKGDLAVTGALAEAGGTLGGSYYTKKKVAEAAFHQEFLKSAEKAGLKVGTEVAEEVVEKEAAQLSFKFAEKAVAKEVVEKAAEKAAVGVIGRTFLKAGVKFIPVVGWGITAVTAGYGLYNIVIADKPFIAKVMLVDPEKVYKLCNE